MRGILCFSVAILLLFTVNAENYSNHVVISVQPTTDDQESKLLSLIEYGQAITWRNQKDGVYELVVENEVYRVMKKVFSMELIMEGEELNRVLENSKKRKHLDASARASVDWTQYNTLDEINAYMETLASENPTLATTSTLGITWEGKEMRMITITNGEDLPDRPLIVLDAGIHAREWVAPATATYIMTQLLTSPLIQDATFVVVPSLNPDGYQFTWDIDGDRLWRKTRSEREELLCLGVDGNRNWDFHWMEVGASNISCSEIYAGPSPNSEPEFQALADFMELNKDRLKMYITLHSYSQLFMSPWGDTTDPPPTSEELNRVSSMAVAAMFDVDGMNYTSGACADILGYLDAGTSRDYMYGAVNVPYVYTIELRDTGKFGFLLPEDEILPTAMETWAGFQVAAQEALNAVAS